MASEKSDVSTQITMSEEQNDAGLSVKSERSTTNVTVDTITAGNSPSGSSDENVSWDEKNDRSGDKTDFGAGDQNDGDDDKSCETIPKRECRCNSIKCENYRNELRRILMDFRKANLQDKDDFSDNNGSNQVKCIYKQLVSVLFTEMHTKCLTNQSDSIDNCKGIICAPKIVENESIKDEEEQNSPDCISSDYLANDSPNFENDSEDTITIEEDYQNEITDPQQQHDVSSNVEHNSHDEQTNNEIDEINPNCNPINDQTKVENVQIGENDLATFDAPLIDAKAQSDQSSDHIDNSLVAEEINKNGRLKKKKLFKKLWKKKSMNQAFTHVFGYDTSKHETEKSMSAPAEKGDGEDLTVDVDRQTSSKPKKKKRPLVALKKIHHDRK